MEMRRAGIQDAELLARLNRDVQQLHVDAHPRLFKAVSDDETVTAWFADLLGQPEAHLLIGTVEAEPVGYIAGMIRRYPANPFRYALDIGLVDQLSIRPEFRRHGYGERLLEKLLDQFRALGIAHIELSVWAFNEGARDFYRRQGFSALHQWMSLDMHPLPGQR